MQLTTKKPAMDKPLLTEEQMDQVVNFKFALELMDRDYPISDVLKKLADKIPNDYDFGYIVKNVIEEIKTNKIG